MHELKQGIIYKKQNILQKNKTTRAAFKKINDKLIFEKN